MKTNKEKLEQVKRILKAQRKRGQNCEKINLIYLELLNCKDENHNWWSIEVLESVAKNTNVDKGYAPSKTWIVDDIPNVDIEAFKKAWEAAIPKTTEGFKNIDIIYGTEE